MPYAVEIWGLNEDRKSPVKFRRVSKKMLLIPRSSENDATDW